MAWCLCPVSRAPVTFHTSLCGRPRPLTRLDLNFIKRSHVEEQTVKLSMPPISSLSSRDGRAISSSDIYTPPTAHSVTAAPNIPSELESRPNKRHRSTRSHDFTSTPSHTCMLLPMSPTTLMCTKMTGSATVSLWVEPGSCTTLPHLKRAKAVRSNLDCCKR